MKIIIIFSFILVFIIAVIFSVLNLHLVQLNLGFTSFPIPLTVALTIELIAGIAIGLLVAFFQNAKLKADYKRLKKHLKNTKK